MKAKDNMPPEEVSINIFSSNNYIRMHWTINGKQYSIAQHRYIWILCNGTIPIGYVIHHINGIRYDNRIENLCMMTIREHIRFHRINNAVFTKLSKSEYKKYLADYQAIYRKQNKDKYNLYQKNYQKDWRIKNRDIINERQRKRRSKV